MTWRERRVADMADLINGFPFESSAFADEGVPLVRIRDIQAEPFQTFLPEEVVPDSAYVQDGDVVIGMDGDFNTVYWLRGAAALNQRLCLLRENGQSDTRFLAYALPAHLKTINDLTYATTVKHLSSGQVRAIKLMAPPLDEQRAIADYLDRETARIDTLIEEQGRLVEMLRERRQAQIDHAVWSGLGDVPRSPCPVEPAPDVPAYWRMMRNKNLVSESTEVSVDGSEELLSVSHLTGITPRSEKNVTMIEAESLDGYRLVEPGDLVINTMWAWMGALGVAQVAGIVSPAYGVYRQLPGADFHAPYYNHLYRSRPYVMEMTRYSRGIWSSRLRIYPEVFLRLNVPVPPLNEQRRIAAYLDEQTAKIDTLIAETEKFIELARERRSALITAAVTGQIDVREVA